MLRVVPELNASPLAGDDPAGSVDFRQVFRNPPTIPRTF
ncbi:hypothetical protein Bphyt_2516 [Paraburkholderia phytofirmans PsJN]|uniref:Uncharacterized protein n=1 Tax=Paraburkholderia phytofirmans (strain DSM 17436 / LMG 22146 / PsJN) TaxID=398527 RepID=B2SXQ5_PARPJ|nr:hypothetical protein Bphyt_2516 [Paraburkholderia phytofirmans PsJN]